jgi:hypothetical protein
LPAFAEWWLKVSIDKLKAEVISLREKNLFFRLFAFCPMTSAFK